MSKVLARLRQQARPDGLPEAPGQGEDGQVRGAVLQPGAGQAVRGGRLHGPPARRTASATYEHGRTTQGEPYLVMEWIDGLGLNYLIETKSPQLKGNRVNYLKQLCDAVEYLHGQKFLHRDLCPRNVMVDQGRAGQADRLRADDPVHAGVLPAGQPDRDGRLPGPGDHQAAADRPPGGHLRPGGDGLRDLHRAAPVGAVAVERGDAPEAPEHPAAGPEGPEPGPGRRPVRAPAQVDQPASRPDRFPSAAAFKDALDNLGRDDY